MARFSIWYIVMTLLVFLILQNYLIGRRVQTISYSEFRKLVDNQGVQDLVVYSDTITGKLTPAGVEFLAQERQDPEWVERLKQLGETEPAFSTVRLEDASLLERLDKQGIEYSARLEKTWLTSLLSWLLPMLLLVGIWIYFFRKIGAGPAGGLMTIGKSKAKIYVEGETKVTFKDVAGVEEAEEELKEIIEFLKNPAKFQVLGGKIPKGVLLVGPPGTGKTLLARAVAGEAKVPFLSLTGSDFVEMFVGVGAARVRDLFAQAQEKAPCIIFIDELDALGKARGLSPMGGHEERENTLNQLLSEMDGFDTRKGVIIMSATNRPEILDPALIRPGRFDRQILVDRPSLKGREEILKVHTGGVKMAPEVDLHKLAARTPGMVGADLANIVNEAALLAARRNKPAIEMVDFEEAIDRVVAGLEKRNRMMNPREKEIVAYHETGHALVAESLPTTDRVHRVSIIPRGIGSLGYTMQLPTEDRYLMTKSELEDRMAVLLGGRVGEELVFDEVSTGAQNDLYRATDIARSMVREYGMSEKLGPVTFERERRPLFLQTVLPPGSKDYSEGTAQEIDREVSALVEKAHHRARDILESKREILEKVAKILLEKEVLEGDELRELLNSVA
ncbi:MAG: ATP-dependent zinc metalloprotease FtsH [Deltaproteobacteria bacterium]|nr:ATP-dependent zinc metalloprotease FtsH [Deltaproteobacteria bacterium]MBW1953040.1 ATP-dependent zinc metalloprotease FtsH [Deltaproteobacteria bacterium]MBW1985968.1 ATP-dependent zinc metalloprotease FtsH [Deltaproteobacteria bacterium]MBW2135471.1 ATP-dependent zinc metalloprotease FtsH [Deltaproteobacteria bacterium]